LLRIALLGAAQADQLSITRSINSLVTQIMLSLSPASITGMGEFNLSAFCGGLIMMNAILTIHQKTRLENFIHPVFKILKAALLPQQVYMAANPQTYDWESFIKTRKWNIIPRLISAIRFFNEYEVNNRDISNAIDRELGLWKAAPFPFRNVPCMFPILFLTSSLR
jgi:hypothetical protein